MLKKLNRVLNEITNFTSDFIGFLAIVNFILHVILKRISKKKADMK